MIGVTTQTAMPRNVRLTGAPGNRSTATFLFSGP
jgi:hypothetical protein